MTVGALGPNDIGEDAKRRMSMNGILCLDKPPDHTSFDVIARVRGILHMKKVGHGGTLDPMATGVLPIFLGYATKCCDILPVERKRYLAQAKIGEATDTQDCTGTVNERDGKRISRQELEEALRTFEGGYEQTPPMYSAIQVGGQRLYDLARQGVQVHREKRRVELYHLELVQFCEEEQTFTLDVECSKGTYVRTLVDDVARQAGTLATLTALRRTESSGFTLKDCVTLEELTRLAAEGEAESVLLPTERVFDALPRVYLSPKQVTLFKNGVRLSADRVRTDTAEGPVAVYGSEEGFLAKATIEEGLLTKVKLFCDRETAAPERKGS